MCDDDASSIVGQLAMVFPSGLRRLIKCSREVVRTLPAGYFWLGVRRCDSHAGVPVLARL